MNILFLSYCTEYEAGWGSRPDGIIFSLTLEDMQRHIAESRNHESYDLYWRYSTPEEVLCDDETYNTVKADIALKTGNPDRTVQGYHERKLKEFNIYKKIT